MTSSIGKGAGPDCRNKTMDASRTKGGSMSLLMASYRLLPNWFVREAGRATNPGDRDTNIAAAASLRSIAGDCGLAESSVTRLAPLVGSGQVPTAVIDADAAGATYLLWTDPSVGQGQGPAERARCSML